MTMSKQNIVPITIFVLVVVILVALTQIFNAPQKAVPVPTPTPQTVLVEPPPRTINFPSVPQGASFVYTGPSKQTPNTMMTYQYTQTLSGDQLTQIGDSVSTQFNLQSTPSAVVDSTGYTYSRNDTNRWFSVSKTKDIVSITYERLLVEDQSVFLLEDPKTIASFLSPLLSLSSNASLNLLSSGAPPLTGVIILEHPQPTLKGYEFGITIDNTPLLTTEYTKRWASIIIDDRGAVRILNYLLPPNITPAGSTPIISLKDAVSNINEGRGSLLWFAQQGGGSSNTMLSFKRGVLTDYALVYIHQNGRLIPAYLFEGNGISSMGNQQTFEVLVVAVVSV